MKFQFPQFIDTKSKIIGPFTLFQFLFIAAGSSLVFILSFLFEGYIFIVMIIVIAIISLGLGFAKIDGVPLPQYILNAFAFIISPKRYIFNKEDKKQDIYGIPEVPKFDKKKYGKEK